MTDGEDLLRSGQGDAGREPLSRRMGEAGQFGATWGAHVPLPDLRDE